MIIRTPQRFAANRVAQQVREAHQALGETMIFLSMYHAFAEDVSKENEFPRCPRCWDEDYGQSTDAECPVCSGTGLSPTNTSQGIKHFGRVSGFFSDNTNNEELLRKYGQFDQDIRNIQIESIFPEPLDNDFIVRVKEWSTDGRPLSLGNRYQIMEPAPQSVRTGNQFGQLPFKDIIGYKFRAQLLRNFHPMYNIAFPSNQVVQQFNP